MENKGQIRTTSILLVVLVLITFVTGLGAFFTLQNVVEQNDSLSLDFSQRLVDVSELRTAAERKVSHSRGFIISKNPELREWMGAARRDFQVVLERLRTEVTTARGKEFLDLIQNSEEQHQAELSKLLAAIDNGASPSLIEQRFENELRPKRLDLRRKLDDFMKYETALINQQRASYNRDSTRAQWILGSVALIGGLLIFLIAYILFRTTKSLQIAQAVANERIVGEERAKERFMDLVNHLDHSVIWEAEVDPFRIRFMSERSQLLFGVPAKEMMESQGMFFNYVYKDDLNPLKDVLAEAIRTRRDQRCDHRMYSGDGTLRWVHTGVHVRLDHDGRYLFYGITMDITPLKEVQANAQTLIHTLEVERDLRERFVNMLTHDLRTPLAAAKMGAHLVSRQHKNPEAVKELAAKIVESVSRSENMIRDLLDANRLQAGKNIPLKVESIEVNKCVSAALTDLSLIYGDRFVLEVSETLYAAADSNALRRIVENLASNAVKYGHLESPIQVRISSYDEWVEIAVNNRNRNVPLSAEEREGLFEPFHRSRTAEASGKIGWGIGLALVRGLVETMGGEIKVQSDQVTGTTFIVRLPRTKPRGEELVKTVH